MLVLLITAGKRESLKVHCHVFHCIKRVQMRIFSGSYFPVFSPNTGMYGPGTSSYLDNFYAVVFYCSGYFHNKAEHDWFNKPVTVSLVDSIILFNNSLGRSFTTYSLYQPMLSQVFMNL